MFKLGFVCVPCMYLNALFSVKYASTGISLSLCFCVAQLFSEFKPTSQGNILIMMPVYVA